MKKILCLFLCTVTLVACNKKSSIASNSEHVHSVVATKKASNSPLYFSGVIKPVKVNTVTTPVDGVIKKLNFSYGQIVEKGQKIVDISSVKLQNELHETVSSYLKTKEAYNNSKTSFEGSSELYKEQIISRQEYFNEKNQLENHELAFLDAKFKLDQLIQSVPGLENKLKNVDVNSLESIRKIYGERLDSVSLYAKRTGIVLFPLKTDDKESSGKEIGVGSEIKKGQALVSIGDLSDLGVVFDVGEMEINKLKSKQKVTVTTPAIPDMQLQGEIMDVAVQSKNGSNYSEGAKFPVKVKVANIPEKFQNELRVGMSVRLQVNFANKPEIMVPLAAIKKEGGRAKVTLVDPKTGSHKTVAVKPGQTTMSDIEILDGLGEGAQVIVNDRT